MAPTIARVVLYGKDIPKVADFYQRHFELRPHGVARTGWLELAPAGGGCTLALHQAARSQR